MLKSLDIQVRVVRSLITRETIRQFGRGNIGFLWLFVEPSLLCLGVTVMWTLLGMGHHEGVTVAAYALTGYMPLTLWRHMSNLAIGILQRNATLLYHRRITTFDLFLARMFQDFLATTFAFVVLTTVMSAIGLLEFPTDIKLVALGWMLQAWLSFGYAAIVAAAAQRFEIAEKFFPVISYVTLPITGAFAMVEWVPPGAREAYTWVPLVHPYEIIREGFLGNVVETHGDPFYVAVWALVLTAVGLFWLDRVRHHVSLN